MNTMQKLCLLLAVLVIAISSCQLENGDTAKQTDNNVPATSRYDWTQCLLKTNNKTGGVTSFGYFTSGDDYNFWYDIYSNDPDGLRWYATDANVDTQVTAAMNAHNCLKDWGYFNLRRIVIVIGSARVLLAGGPEKVKSNLNVRYK